MIKNPSPILSVCICLLIFAHCSNIDYQIHSYNDLREWNQALIKGARAFKVDPHFVESSKCAKAGITNPNGCLILNHDTPFLKKGKFSTSDDLLAFLGTSEFEMHRKNEPVSIALCYKAVPDFCNFESSKFTSWLALADDFFERATSEVSNTVEFILDGDGKPRDCLIGRWTPWNSVWINTGGPEEAFYSNDAENDYYRYQVLNDPENTGNWTWMVEQNYGKFSNSSYPYQLWEPDAQSDFEEYISLYQSGKEHQPGFHFAINVDIAMFDVYTGNATGRSINQRMFPKASKPQLVGLTSTTEDVHLFGGVFVNPAAEKHGSTSLVFTLLESVDGVEATTSMTADVPSSTWLLSSEGLVSNAVPAALTHLSVNEDLEMKIYSLLLVMNTGKYVQLDVDPENMMVFEEGRGVLPLSDIGSDLLDITPMHCPEDSQSTPTMENMCFSALSLLNDTLITASTVSLQRKLASFESIVIESDTVYNVVHSGRRSGVSGSIALSSDNSDSSFLIFLSINDTIVAAEYHAKYMANTLQWVKIGKGGNIDVDTAVLGGEKVLLLVADGGYCYNSHSHNTRGYPSLCSQIPFSTPYVLDYSVGYLSDWIDFLSTEGELNSCHSRLLHGSFDQGSHPTVALSTHNGQHISMLECHEGVPEGRFSAMKMEKEKYVERVDNKVLNGCGDPTPHDGLVFDSFRVQAWLNDLKLLKQ